LVDRDVGDPGVADLAFVLKLLDRPDRLLVGDVFVGSMELVEIDALDPEPLQRALAGPA
jgi:hypothetical protein